MRRLFATIPLVMLATPLGLAGCGVASNSKHPGAPHAKASAPTAGSVGPSGTSPGPAFHSTDVPMATMPPPFQFGSRKTETKIVAAWRACHISFRTQSADLSADVAGLGKACADATKMRPLGPPLTGAQAQGAQAQAYPLKAEANHCYRVYGTTAATVRNIEVLIVDSTGAAALETRGDDPRIVAPSDGAVCFRSADNAQVLVSIGAGQGAYALQIWSD